jgi:hypothetical protein
MMPVSLPILTTRFFAGLLFGLALLTSIAPGHAAELVMFDRAGCVWCARWDREIGASYPLTEEGKRAPLRRVSLDRALPDDLKLDPPVRFSPTFVLLHEGREVGRITGYIGEFAFWGLLTPMIARLNAAATHD